MSNSAAHFQPAANQTLSAQELPVKLCLGISRLFFKSPLRRFSFNNDAVTERFASYDNYINDRVSNIEHYYQLFNRFVSFSGRTVLDLGANSGYLLANFLQFDQFNAIGADINPEVLARGQKSYRDRIRFVQTTTTKIPVEDSSVDIIYTIDTVEHLSRPKEIFLDAYRILKPGGIFLVHFGPWFNPYGSHLEDIIPFPWPQTIFSMKTLLKVAAILYDSPEYKPACYWFDPETGERRANPYLDEEKWNEFLNHMTIARFKQMLKELPFEQIHGEKFGFGGKKFKIGPLLKSFAQLPLLDELFTSNLLYVLRKPV